MVIFCFILQEKCAWNVKHRPILFLLVLLLVVSVIGALVHFTTDVFDKPKALKYEPLEFQQLMTGKYEPNHFNGTWVSGKYRFINFRIWIEYDKFVSPVEAACVSSKIIYFNFCA